jgi:hypothetical protein
VRKHFISKSLLKDKLEERKIKAKALVKSIQKVTRHKERLQYDQSKLPLGVMQNKQHAVNMRQMCNV